MAASIGMRPSLLKVLFLPRTYCLSCLHGEAASSSTATVNEITNGSNNTGNIPRGQIKIPRRKKRDATAILEALASTVKRDPTAPIYSMIDDPCLMPQTYNNTKFALLSKASGRRTARYMINEFRQAFEHDAAAPHVEAFQPKDLDYKYTDPTIEALVERIELREVDDATEVYNRMLEQGSTVPEETLLRLLELLCVFDGKNSPTSKYMPEENLISKDIQVRMDKQSNQLSLNLAMEVFESLTDKTADAYNWIVRALLKNNVSKGMILIEEMWKSKIPVYLGTYNEYVSYTARRTKSPTWQGLEKCLNKIKESGLAPNLETFHHLIEGCTYLKKDSNFKPEKQVPQILAEMKGLDIEPTLATWSLILSALGGDQEETSETIVSDLVDIITYLKENVDKDIVYTDDPKDNFFLKAMSICSRNRAGDVAIKLYELKEAMGNNYITTSLQDDRNFYQNLLQTVCMTETPQDVMKIYDETLYRCFSSNVFLKVLGCLDSFGEYQYVLRIWQDAGIDLGGYLDNRLLMRFLEIFSMPDHPREFRDKFCTIADKLLEDRLGVEQLKVQLFDDTLFSYLIKIFLQNDQLDSAWNACMKFYAKKYEGYIRPQQLINLFKLCVKEKDVEKIKNFCQLPIQSRDSKFLSSMVNVIDENNEVLENVLNHSELKMLQDKFCSA